jgi:protein-tyrosine phosphatase
MNRPEITAEQKRWHDELYANSEMLPFEWNWLEERIAAGRHPLTAVDVVELAQAGITHILDLRREEEWSEVFPGQEALEFCVACQIQRSHLPLTNLQAPCDEDFQQASAWLETALQDPSAKIYVHCRAGMERTATIVIAFYACRTGQDYDAAFEELKQKRPIFQPLPHQESAVRTWLKAKSATAD